MRAVVAAFIACVLSVSALGQAAGDYRSAVVSGPWNANGSWETFDGASWVPATFQPFLTSGLITIRSGHTITITSNISNIDDIVVNGSLVINSGVTVPLNNVNADAITVATGGILDVSGTITFQTNAKLRVSGTVIGRNTSTTQSSFASSTATNCIFLANSTYNHIYTSQQGTIPVANWDTASTLLISGAVTTNTPPTNLNQAFGNVTYNTTGTATNLGFLGNLTHIKGNFSTLSTHTRIITFSPTAGYSLAVDGDFNLASSAAVTLNSAASGTTTLTVGGSFSQTAGTFNLATGTASINMSVAKNYTRTFGTLSKAGTGTATLTFNGTTQTQVVAISGAGSPFSAINFVVANGSTTDLGSSTLNGTGSFTLNSGGTLVVGSTDSGGAISTTGNIAVGGAKTYNSGSTIIYRNNTNTSQFLGTDHPGTAGITTIIDNTGGVTLQPSSFVLNGNLVLTNGNFNINGRSLTLGGTFTGGSNFLVGNLTTTLTISDGGTTADFNNLRVSGTSIIGALNIQGSTGRTVRLGADITVANDVNLLKGDLQLNGFNLNIGGGITQTLGTLTASAASTLTISDLSANPLPADLIISGGALGTLTMDRAGAEFVTSSNLNITTLNLTTGTLTHNGTLTMVSNGKVNVGTGILTNPLAAATVYDVEYNGTSEADTGAELPSSGTILRHLIVSNPTQVNLKQPGAVVNGDLILTAGIFFADTTDITLRGNFQSDGISDFTAGTTFFDGTTTITGSVVPQFGNVTINASQSLTLGPLSQINVSGNLNHLGTFNTSTGTVSLNGMWTDQLVQGSATTQFYGLEINKPADDLNVQHTVTIQHAVEVQDVLRVLTATQVAAGTNQVTLISNASRTARVNPLITGAAINGSVIVQRYLPNGVGTKQFRYIAPPVTNTSVADWQAEFPVTGTFTDPSSGGSLIPTEISMYYYVESFLGNGTAMNARYLNYPSTGTAASNPLVSGRGYTAYTYAFQPITFDSRGTLGQGQVPLAVTAQSAGGNDGWNLLGNPYPSPVLWDKISRTAGVDNAVYIPDKTNINGGGFMTYVGGVGTPANFTGEIDMAQAFWVHATSSGTVTFNETDKIISTDSVVQMFRQGQPSDLLRIKIASSTAKDEIAIRFLEEANDSYDPQYDALKLKASTVNLSSMSSDSREMTINTMGSMDCLKRVALVITEAQAGSYTLSASGFDSFGSDTDIKLIDNKTSATIDLRKTNTYDFTVTAGELATLTNRFSIEAGKTRVLTDLPLGGPTICFNDFTGDIHIDNTQPEIDYQVFSGQTAVSDLVKGNSGEINISINTKSLPVGNSTFTITAKNSCTTRTLDKTAIVVKTDLTPAPQVSDVTACSSSDAILKATGAGAGQSYSWFSSADATSPLAVTTDGSYQASGLTGNTSYFVAVSNSIGCAGERKKINVKVVNPDPVEINQNGTILTSSYFTGNQWYFNGSIMTGQNAPSLNATANGTYTVKVNVDGCVTEASIVQEVTGLEENSSSVGIYPNPVGASMNIEFPTGIAGTTGVSIINTSGKIVYSGSFNAPGVVTIDTSDITAGVYIVRLEVDGQIISRKIIKL
jgi:hypothetical protein